MSKSEPELESSGSAQPPPDDHDPLERFTGKCKWFNVTKGYGFIIPDNLEDDVFVHQTELRMEGFRSLEEGERVSFLLRRRQGGQGWEAYSVGAETEGASLQGSSIRPLGKKKDTLVRCFKCGKYGNHLASRCKRIDIETKICYHCGGDGHLFNMCPRRAEKRAQKSQQQ